jgi:hypothetical protein
MHDASRRYIPALGFDFPTPLYDPLVAATTRERVFVLDVGCVVHRAVRPA